VRVVGSVVGGRNAVAEAERLQPRIILLDLQMPDVPGLKLLPQLRTGLPNAIIIALSLLDPDEYEDPALAAGADAFVSKMNVERDLLPSIRTFGARDPRSPATAEE
jgi:DNA-binding NarL/FixJ family response regulator